MASAVPRLLICDFDETLADSKQDISNALAWCFSEALDKKVTGEDILPFIGQGLQVMFNHFLPGMKVGSPEFMKALLTFQAYYKEHCDIHTKTYPGVKSTLAALKDKGVLLAIATNKHGHIARHVSGKLGIEGYFDHIQGTEKHRGKPDPGVIIATLEALEIPADAAIKVGDKGNDMKAAKATGCMAIGVSYGVDPVEKLEEAGAEGIIESFDQILTYFE